VVLNPEWLTKAIGYVLEDEKTRTDQGVLDHARLKDIWEALADGARYHARYHPYFLRLMEKFDVSYRLEDDPRRSLVAQLVPHQRPTLDWERDSPLPAGRRRLALTCQLSEPAPGLMAWLTVRHHRASTGKHWRRGVFLRHPITAYASEALIELPEEHHLTVEVRAPSPDLYFNVIRDSIQDLVTTRWPGLSYHLSVPCPVTTPDGSPCPGSFPLDYLLGLRERHRTSCDCRACFGESDVTELLTGFAPPPLPFKAEFDQIHEQLDRVEGYAATAADTVRRILKAVSTEVTDCPRLFTITAEPARGWQQLNLAERHYELILWCEHPGHWHPWPQARYQLAVPRDWLVTIAPYANLVLKTLKIATPIAAAVAGVELSKDQREQASAQLDLMKTLVEKLPEKAANVRDVLHPDQDTRQLTPAQGEALRGIRALLRRHDPMQSFGDLRRVHAPSGDLLWVCPRHYPQYDPGLPTL
jgi:hypothetical protein